jgi:Undecaprenyl-phosphate glucose phosphotransferase
MQRLFDITAFTFSAYLAYSLLTDGAAQDRQYLLAFFAILLVLNILFSITNVYRDWRGYGFHRQITNLAFSWSLLFMLIVTSMFLLKVGETYSRLWVGLAFSGGFLVSLAGRATLTATNSYWFGHTKKQKNVVILGADLNGQKLAARMLERPWAGLLPVAFFDSNPAVIGKRIHGIPIVGNLGSIGSFIEKSRRSNGQGRNVIQEVWITLALSSRDDAALVEAQLADTAARVRLIPHMEHLDGRHFQLNETLGLPVIDLSELKVDSEKLLIKRAIDFCSALLGLILLSPLLALVAILIKSDSAGPVLFKQKRYGLDGKEFDLWKFRSMTLEASQFASVEQAHYNDLRVTKIGKWLRKYSIDELPQLMNVVIGDMSLVGPRPHATSHNEFYRTKIDGYMSRHSARPGITGWAQVNGLRGETPMLSDMQERLKHDIYYIRNWSLFLDTKILIKTIAVVVSAKGAY